MWWGSWFHSLGTEAKKHLTLGLVKTVMLGMVHGDRPKGRPLRHWIDNIRENVLPAFMKQQHWLGVRRLTVSSLLSTAHLRQMMMLMIMIGLGLGDCGVNSDVTVNLNLQLTLNDSIFITMCHVCCFYADCHFCRVIRQCPFTLPSSLRCVLSFCY